MSQDAEKLLHINSKDRDSLLDTTSNSFSVTISNHTLVSNANSLSLKSVQFMNTFYNINANNNTFYFHVAVPATSANELSIQLPIGQYTLATLITAFNAAMLADHTIITTLTENTLTRVLDWTSDTGIVIRQTRAELVRVDNPMFEVLGIRGDGNTLITAYTSPAVYDVSGLKSLYIHSKSLAGGSCVTSRGSGHLISLLAIIPINVPFGGIQNYNDREENDRHFYSNFTSNNLTFVDIELRDEDHNLVDLNGHDISLTCKIYC